MFDENNLRHWQKEATNKALECFKNYKRFLISAAPGTGKTICATVIAKRLINQNKIDRVITLAPRRQVVKQWGEDFKFITNRPMMKITGADKFEDFGIDICATWQSVDTIIDALQFICENNRTLVICDEHHHASDVAVWGKGANEAFLKCDFTLMLSGTPIRPDGNEPIWIKYDYHGNIDLPESAQYTLTYGEAVDLGYCRPITFHRHHGEFSVEFDDGANISVSGEKGPVLDKSLQKINGLKQALEYYQLVCKPQYQKDGITPMHNSYQQTMLKEGIQKLNQLRNTLPNAGGLVIAPSIEMAEYIAKIIEMLEGEKPVIVHSEVPNVEDKIAMFKNTDKRWIVSVAMISEGVDIKRLRVLIYLPNAQTELSFRQSMGRVVRSYGKDDITRAYVIMPTHKIFEVFAKRVENEMSPSKRKDNVIEAKHKICPVCEEINHLNAEICKECEYQFPKPKQFKIKCDKCGTLNNTKDEHCINCGCSMKQIYKITLNEALRDGAIIRGMDIDEVSVKKGEEIAPIIKEKVLRSGHEKLIQIIKQLPDEQMNELAQFFKDSKF